MLATLKWAVKTFFLPFLYAGAVAASYISLFKDAAAGLFVLAFFLPQPNVWYKLFAFPMGHDFIDLLFFSVLGGIYMQRKNIYRPQNIGIILSVVCLSYIDLWHSSFRFSLPLPVTLANPVLADWKNYAEMMGLYFLAFHAIDGEERQKKVITLMGLAMFVICLESMRHLGAIHAYRENKRSGGPFEVCGLDANFFGAFIAYVCIAFLGIALFDKDRRRRLLLLTVAAMGIFPLLISYSRGAYLACVAGLLTFGLVKKRKLLLLVLVLLAAWKTVLPASVVDRIAMTETKHGKLEASAEERLGLWKRAEGLFREDPVFGIGWDGFFLDRAGHTLRDTHNFYMRTLCEEGLVGIVLLLMLFFRAFRSGWRLFRTARSDFMRGLGFGFMGCIVTVAVANLFGDRWTPLPMTGYIWILWGMVDRAATVSKEEAQP